MVSFPVLQKLISGGQTGADRAALDFAIARGIPHGGWCPRGRWAEDGVIPDGYQLVETPASDPAQRTERNVRDSDGTVIFSILPVLTGGSLYTENCARKYGRPWLHLCRAREGESAPAKLREFICQHGIRVLNVAGPRKSQEPDVTAFVRLTLEQWQSNFGL